VPLHRLEQSYIEIKDVVQELSAMLNKVEADPSRMEYIKERLDLFYSLQQKHQVDSQEALIEIRDGFDRQLAGIELSSENIEKLDDELKHVFDALIIQAESLSGRRKSGIDNFCKKVVNLLAELGMPNARFEMGHKIKSEPGVDGLDEMEFLFSANKNQVPEPVSKVASGGEISRLMLSIKSLVSKSLDIPTLIFDEIDAGVSGEIADKLGRLIKTIADGRQVLNITHLPQVARSGDQHYLVYKYDDESSSHTGIKQLNSEERVVEMAKMLSGEILTDEALMNARQLLN